MQERAEGEEPGLLHRIWSWLRACTEATPDEDYELLAVNSTNDDDDEEDPENSSDDDGESSVMGGLRSIRDWAVDTYHKYPRRITAAAVTITVIPIVFSLGYFDTAGMSQLLPSLPLWGTEALIVTGMAFTASLRELAGWLVFDLWQNTPKWLRSLRESPRWRDVRHGFNFSLFLALPATIVQNTVFQIQTLGSYTLVSQMWGTIFAETFLMGLFGTGVILVAGEIGRKFPYTDRGLKFSLFCGALSSVIMISLTSVDPTNLANLGQTFTNPEIFAAIFGSVGAGFLTVFSYDIYQHFQRGRVISLDESDEDEDKNETDPLLGGNAPLSTYAQFNQTVQDMLQSNTAQTVSHFGLCALMVLSWRAAGEIAGFTAGNLDVPITDNTEEANQRVLSTIGRYQSLTTIGSLLLLRFLYPTKIHGLRGRVIKKDPFSRPSSIKFQVYDVGTSHVSRRRGVGTSASEVLLNAAERTRQMEVFQRHISPKSADNGAKAAPPNLENKLNYVNARLNPGPNEPHNHTYTSEQLAPILTSSLYTQENTPRIIFEAAVKLNADNELPENFNERYERGKLLYPVHPAVSIFRTIENELLPRRSNPLTDHPSLQLLFNNNTAIAQPLQLACGISAPDYNAVRVSTEHPLAKNIYIIEAPRNKSSKSYTLIPKRPGHSVTWMFNYLLNEEIDVIIAVLNPDDLLNKPIAKYWENNSKWTGANGAKYQVTSTEDANNNNTVIKCRKLTLKINGKTIKTFTHFQLPNIPDFDVPQNLIPPVIKYIHDNIYRPILNKKTVIHCAAGIGRGPTVASAFIYAFDGLVDNKQNASEASERILRTTLALREKRPGSLQLRIQFIAALRMASFIREVELTNNHHPRTHKGLHTTRGEALEKIRLRLVAFFGEEHVTLKTEGNLRGETVPLAEGLFELNRLSDLKGNGQFQAKFKLLDCLTLISQQLLYLRSYPPSPQDRQYTASWKQILKAIYRGDIAAVNKEIDNIKPPSPYYNLLKNLQELTSDRGKSEALSSFDQAPNLSLLQKNILIQDLINRFQPTLTNVNQQADGASASSAQPSAWKKYTLYVSAMLRGGGENEHTHSFAALANALEAKFYNGKTETIAFSGRKSLNATGKVVPVVQRITPNGQTQKSTVIFNSLTTKTHPVTSVFNVLKAALLTPEEIQNKSKLIQNQLLISRHPSLRWLFNPVTANETPAQWTASNPGYNGTRLSSQPNTIASNIHILEAPRTDKALYNFLPNREGDSTAWMLEYSLKHDVTTLVTVGLENAQAKSRGVCQYWQGGTWQGSNGTKYELTVTDGPTILDNIISRKLQLKINGKVKKTFVHYHLPNVPDVDIPRMLTTDDYQTLYGIYRQTKQNKTAIHCSAGLGRAPILALAFILAADGLVDKKIPINVLCDHIVKTLLTMREHRPLVPQLRVQVLAALRIAVGIRKIELEKHPKLTAPKNEYYKLYKDPLTETENQKRLKAFFGKQLIKRKDHASVRINRRDEKTVPFPEGRLTLKKSLFKNQMFKKKLPLLDCIARISQRLDYQSGYQTNPQHQHECEQWAKILKNIYDNRAPGNSADEDHCKLVDELTTGLKKTGLLKPNEAIGRNLSFLKENILIQDLYQRFDRPPPQPSSVENKGSKGKEEDTASSSISPFRR